METDGTDLLIAGVRFSVSFKLLYQLVIIAGSAFCDRIPCLIAALRQPRADDPCRGVSRLPRVFPVKDRYIRTCLCEMISRGRTENAGSDNHIRLHV